MPGRRPVRSPTCRSRGSRCSRDARRLACPNHPSRRPSPAAEPVADPAAVWRPAMTRRDYDAAVDRIHRAIAAGDTYQVNLTMPLEAEVRGDPRGLYRDLSYAQRGAYGAYVDTGTHPHPVGLARALLPDRRGPDRDEADEGHRPARTLARRRRGDPRRARGIGEGSRRERDDRRSAAQRPRARRPQRVASRGATCSRPNATRPSGSSRPPSAPACVPRSGSPTSSRALFPCGSVTGAPKVSTMRIIAGLEVAARGVYCGTVGYLAPAGAAGPRARFNVAIRTVLQDARTGARGLRGRRGHHVGLARGRGVRRDGREGPRPHDPPSGPPAPRDARLRARHRLPTPRRAPGASARVGLVSRHDARRGRDPRGARPGGRSLRRSPRASASWSTAVAAWNRGRRRSRRRSSPSGWPSIVPTRSTRPTRCCSTRRPRARGTTGRAIGSPTRTTSCW